MRTIQFYRLPNGECPVETFLDALSGKQAQKVVWVLRLIEELERVPAQYFKKLVNTEGIWEVRAQLGTDAFRLLGFFAEPTVFVLTNGFAKKTQKTPSREIATALRRRAEYIAERKP